MRSLIKVSDRNRGNTGYNRKSWINNWLTDRNQSVGNKICVHKVRVTHEDNPVYDSL